MGAEISSEALQALVSEETAPLRAHLTLGSVYYKTSQRAARSSSISTCYSLWDLLEDPQSITFLHLLAAERNSAFKKKMTPCFSGNYLLYLSVRVGNRELPLREHSSQK